MNKQVKIEKTITFSSMIGEITAISLEKENRFKSENEIEGHFILSGKYKETLASQIEENFYYEIPFNISLTDRIEKETAKVEITDFNYDIVESNSINCKIELSIDAIELLEDRECDGEKSDTKEIELPHIEETKEDHREEIIKKEQIEEEKDNMEITNKEENQEKSLFNIDDENEDFGTFIVYIVRQNETINTVIEKYHTSLEEIEKYNDIKEITVGTKIIIPYHNEQNT